MIRLQWSQFFKCDLPKKDLSVVGAIAGGFVALVIFFYCGLKLYGYFDEKKEKRLVTGEHKHEQQLLSYFIFSYLTCSYFART